MGLNNLRRETQLHTTKPNCTTFQGQMRGKAFRPVSATENNVAAKAMFREPELFVCKMAGQHRSTNTQRHAIKVVDIEEIKLRRRPGTLTLSTSAGAGGWRNACSVGKAGW